MELHRAIRLPEVLRMTGMSRSAWYALLNPRLPTYDHCAPSRSSWGTAPARPPRGGRGKCSPICSRSPMPAVGTKENHND
ncbi:AlpA family phage regulatory protein [Rhodanobacter caeni]